MDLKIKDVAELLNVSEKTIRRWLAEGKIPAYRLNSQYRFSRIEIENWVMSCKLSKNQPGFLTLAKQELEVGPEPLEIEETETKSGIQQFSLYRAVHKGGVFADIQGNTKEEIIANTMKRVAGLLGRDPEMLKELLFDRERLMPTGLNHGIAVPHSRDIVFEGSYDVVVVVFPEQPILYGSLDGEPVHTLFFLFASGDKRHLHLLAKIAHLSGNETAQQFLRSRPDKQQFLEYLRDWEANLEPIR
ncbi:MAG: PTS sugar transporter subunit IIA [Simkania sp.]|nr:PTS sugar transporter subunit IIA [Simkania sp.]